MTQIAPFRTGDGNRWEGIAPWKDIQVSVIIPLLEYSPMLEYVIEAIQCQTVKSVIYFIDTGSILSTQKIEALRSPQIEIIQIRLQGWPHSSWPVAAGIDAAWNCINTPYAFLTHNDCIIRKKTAFEELIKLTKIHQVVGHQLTERPFEGWEQHFGHTCLMLDVEKMDRINISWNMRKYAMLTGKPLDSQKSPNDPDTESFMNYLLHKNGLIPSFNAKPNQPLFIGKETNCARNIDEWIDHCRSTTCGFLYGPEHYAKTLIWGEQAINDAKNRHEKWKKD